MRRHIPEWWEAGIRFTCLPNCGRCCDEPDGLVYLTKVDARRIAAILIDGNTIRTHIEADAHAERGFKQW